MPQGGSIGGLQAGVFSPPGGVVLEISAERELLCKRLPSILKTVFPAEVHINTTLDKELFLLKVLVFIDYIPIHVEFKVTAISGRDEAVRVMFKDISKQDTVRFGRFARELVEGMRKNCGWTVNVIDMLDGLKAPPCSFGITDDLDDLEAELLEGEDFEDQIASLWSDVCGMASHFRDEALQTLARWADLRPSCRPAMAHAMVANEEALLRLLSPALPQAAPLDWNKMQMLVTELYPLAAVLRFTSLCPEASAVLATAESLAGIISAGASKTSIGERSALLAGHFEMAAQSLCSPAREAVFSLGATKRGHLSVPAVQSFCGRTEASTNCSGLFTTVKWETERTTINSVENGVLLEPGEGYSLTNNKASLPSCVEQLVSVTDGMWTNEEQTPY